MPTRTRPEVFPGEVDHGNRGPVHPEADTPGIPEPLLSSVRMPTDVAIVHEMPTLELGDTGECEPSPGHVRSERAEPGRDRAAEVEQRCAGARYDTSVPPAEVRAALTHDVRHAPRRGERCAHNSLVKERAHRKAGGIVCSGQLSDAGVGNRRVLAEYVDLVPVGGEGTPQIDA